MANAGKYMDKVDGYEAAVAALKEAEVYSSALTTEQAGEQDHLLPVDKQENLNELNANQTENLHPIMMKSVLVCKKGGGAIITIVDTGQDAALEEQMINILQAMYPDEEITVDNYADKLAGENMLAWMRIFSEDHRMPLILTQEQIDESQEVYNAIMALDARDHISFDSEHYDNRFPNGQCTWFAYGRSQELTGNTIEFDQPGDLHGATWSTRSTNTTSSDIPVIGAIMVWNSNAAGGYGHVAVVERATPITDEDGNIVDYNILYSDANSDNAGNEYTNAGGLVHQTNHSALNNFDTYLIINGSE